MATRATEECATCGQPITTAFCPECGERRPSDRRHTLKEFAAEAIEAVVSFDGRLLRSLRTLVTRPGELTVAYMRGMRVPYLSPLQLFLVINVVFFLWATFVGWKVFDTPLASHLRGTPYASHAARMVDARLAERHVTMAEYSALFDATSAAQAKTLVLITVPAFALVAAVVAAGRRRYAVQHLAFAFHALTFLLLLVIASKYIVIYPAVWWMQWRHHQPTNAALNDVLSWTLGIGFVLYLVPAARRVYTLSWMRALIAGGALSASFILILGLYRRVLFFVTYWST